MMSASEIFHRAMGQVVECLEGVPVYVDAIIVWASTRKEYNERLAAVAQSVQDWTEAQQE